jgi:hypothetical protein
MELFRRVPDVIIREWFIDWCYLEDLAKFDTALTNRHGREFLLSMFTSEKNVFCWNILISMTSNSLKWLLLKQIRIDKIVLEKSRENVQELCLF